MFVIRRKLGQSIRIGDHIVVEVLDATPNRVKLGIHAPAEVRVARTEVLLAESQNREAAGTAAADALASLARQFREQGEPDKPTPPASGVPGPEPQNPPS